VIKKPLKSIKKPLKTPLKIEISNLYFNGI